MTSLLTVVLLLTVTSLASYSLAHSGRTDSNGGHNCYQKSIEWLMFWIPPPSDLLRRSHDGRDS